MTNPSLSKLIFFQESLNYQWIPHLSFFCSMVLPCFICTPMALDPLAGDYRQVHGSGAFPWFVMSSAPGWWWQRWWGGSPNPRRCCSFPKVAWLSSGGWTTAGWPPKHRSRTTQREFGHGRGFTQKIVKEMSKKLNRIRALFKLDVPKSKFSVCGESIPWISPREWLKFIVDPQAGFVGCW